MAVGSPVKPDRPPQPGLLLAVLWAALPVVMQLAAAVAASAVAAVALFAEGPTTVRGEASGSALR